jgi:hypothetical protein
MLPKHVKQLNEKLEEHGPPHGLTDLKFWSFSYSHGRVFAAFQSTSNGGSQCLSNRRSNRHIMPLYGKSDRPFTRVF